ncbi:MAG TPA: VWA domain-containing protein [Vicinamibacterales bacterium]|jgi:Ca-activated chloride channel family protein|nr:VWA domain-containing protein [Vicinamibacterales bacterium]
MTRALAVLTLAGLLTYQVASSASSSSSVQQPPPQEPTFRGTADVVRVFVTVTDRSGKLVTNLTQKDFEIRDEGKPQPITQFDNTPQPIRLIVLLDVSGSMEGNLGMLRMGTSQLFTRLLPADAVRVGTFGQDINITPTFTRDAGELMAALPDTIPSNAPTPLWRAIDEALTAFQGTDDGRSVILVLSDGKDAPAFSFKERPVSQGEIIDRARKQDVTIYAVGLYSRAMRPAMPTIGPGGLQAALMADLPDPGLAKVADQTGGGYTEIRPGQDLGAAFGAVADELHNQYLLGFVPPKRDGKVHDIDVRLATGGLKPRARSSYVAPKG